MREIEIDREIEIEIDREIERERWQEARWGRRRRGVVRRAVGTTTTAQTNKSVELSTES